MKYFYLTVRWDFKSQYEVFIVLVSQYEDRFIFVLMKTKHPAHLMMFRVVTSDENVIPSLFSSHSLKFNTESYIEDLVGIELTWNERVATGRPYRTLYHTT